MPVSLEVGHGGQQRSLDDQSRCLSLAMRGRFVELPDVCGGCADLARQIDCSAVLIGRDLPGSCRILAFEYRFGQLLQGVEGPQGIAEVRGERDRMKRLRLPAQFFRAGGERVCIGRNAR
jgi:hypothetical protein